LANCTPQDVRLIINTKLTDGEVETLIGLADQEMADRSLGDRPAKTKRLLSMLLTASYIALRDPDSVSIGEYREATSPSRWREAAERLIASSRALGLSKVDALEDEG